MSTKEHRLSPEEHAIQQEQRKIENLKIYYGPRDDGFKKVVITYLSRGNLKKEYLDLILRSDIWDLYGDAFISDTTTNYFDEKQNKILVDKESTKNYKVFEKLGNGVFNSFLSFYVFRYFSDKIHRKVYMVQIYGDIKSYYGESNIMYPIAKNLGFWPYISSSEYERKHNEKTLCVSVFYAIIGVTYYILDKNFKKGVGYAICYNILSNIFEDYVKLETDPDFYKPFVSKLNEFTQKNKKYEITYDTERKIIDDINKTETTCKLIENRSKKIIQKFIYVTDSGKAESRKGAAHLMYDYLESKGLIGEKIEKTEVIVPFMAPRDNRFKEVIKNYLLLGNTEPKYIDVLLRDESLKIYGDVFTSDTITDISLRKESSNNYEVFEKLGDGVFNSFFSFYSFRDFGEDRRAVMSQLYSDLKSKYGKGVIMAEIADKNLKFWDFISSSKDQRISEKKKLLEDVFEAIIGATYYILDKNFRQGVGYTICYNILENIFKTHIVLETNPQDLKSYISKLNEFIYQNVDEYKIEYVDKRLSTTGEFGLTETSVILSFVDVMKPPKIIGIGKAATKKDSKEEAAKQAYKYLVDNKIFYRKLKKIAESAIKDNDISTLKSTLSSIDSYGLTYILDSLILEAVKYGNDDSIDIVKLLIEYGADVKTDDSYDSYGNYLLMFAQHNINIFKLLLENGADINQNGPHGSVLTDYIYENGDSLSFEHIKFLIDSGADVNYGNDLNWRGNTPLMRAIESGGSKRLELIKFLLDNGANNFEYEENHGYKVIHLAFKIDDENEVYQIVKLLVDAGANVNAPTSEYDYEIDDLHGDTPLTLAIESGYISVVNFLLENGADIYIKNSEGKDSLTLAIESSNTDTDIINLILSYAKEQEILNTLNSFLKSTDLSTTTDAPLAPLNNVDAIEHMMENIVTMVHGDSK
jgi:ankyrin repeat protein/dsRNA-specific ribonuclease